MTAASVALRLDTSEEPPSSVPLIGAGRLRLPPAPNGARSMILEPRDTYAVTVQRMLTRSRVASTESKLHMWCVGAPHRNPIRRP